MANRLIASDASPLIGLATAGVFDLALGLYGRVTVTRTVRDEIMAGGKLPGAQELSAAMRAGWIRVAPAPMETWTFAELGAGEASTIALALRHAGPAIVLMDDLLGRARATASGREVVGLPDLLVAAKRARLVDRIEPLFDRLARRGFVIHGDSVRAALTQADEWVAP
jgi:predicted nucleic acid-binding protein